MPICYRIDEQENGSYWLWLEDVQDDIGVVWPVERFGLAARHLGHFNGQYLVGKPLPQAEWFGRKPTLQWDATERVLAQLESVRDYPLVARAYTPENARGVRRLWEDRHTLLAALETLPTTLCHLDAQRSNLMARQTHGVDRTVAIDSGRPGIGSLGIDVAQLAVNFRSVRDVDINDMRDLNDLVFEGYLAGFRDVGWTGDPGILRLGYVASIALQNGLMDFWNLRGVIDPRRYPRMRLLWGDRSVEENLDRRGALLRLILELADEARQLINDT